MVGCGVMGRKKQEQEVSGKKKQNTCKAAKCICLFIVANQSDLDISLKKYSVWLRLVRCDWFVRAKQNKINQSDVFFTAKQEKGAVPLNTGIDRLFQLSS